MLLIVCHRPGLFPTSSGTGAGPSRPSRVRTERSPRCKGLGLIAINVPKQRRRGGLQYTRSSASTSFGMRSSGNSLAIRCPSCVKRRAWPANQTHETLIGNPIQKRRNRNALAKHASLYHLGFSFQRRTSSICYLPPLPSMLAISYSPAPSLPLPRPLPRENPCSSSPPPSPPSWLLCSPPFPPAVDTAPPPPPNDIGLNSR
jgi:hypothetical protein